MIQSVHLLLLLLAAGLHVEPCSCQVVLGEYPSPTSVATYRPVTASSICGANGAENYCRYTTDATASLAPNCMSTVCNNTCPFSSSSPPPIQIATLGTLGAGVTTTNGRPGTATGALRFVNSSINVSETLLPIVDGRGFSFAAWINQDEENTGYDNLVYVIYGLRPSIDPCLFAGCRDGVGWSGLNGQTYCFQLVITCSVRSGQ